MQQELDEFTSTLINLYSNNLTFLKNNYPKVFEKVENLSKVLEENESLEKYSLEYNSKGYFDIYDKKKQDFIYGFNSYEEADKRRDITTFDQKDTLSLLRADLNTNKFALNPILGDILPLVDYLNNTIDFDNINFLEIQKFIFIGTGVGVHIHEIYKKINARTTLIIEPNLEIFRLSLFVIDYSIFNSDSKKLFLSIDENIHERIKTLNDFTMHHEYMNHTVKYHLFWVEYKYILDEVIEFYGDNNPLSFPYNTVLEVYSRTLDFMKKKYNFISEPLIQEKPPLKDKKVIVLGAGPSLDIHLEWIKKYQEKLVIVCVDAITKKLEKNGITPDIVTSIDPSPICGKYLSVENKDFLKDSAILFLAQQDKFTVDVVKDLNFYFSQPIPISKKLNYALSLPNVGAFAFAICSKLGAKEIYLTGNDAAFNQETGSVYASDCTNKTSFDITKDANSAVISVDDVVLVKGNFKEKVKTNRKLLSFKKDYESFLKNTILPDDFKAYNLSDGAFIDGLIPLDYKEIQIEKFPNKNIKIIEKLDSIKENDFTDELSFDSDVKAINSMILKVKNFKKLKIKNKDDFYSKKIDLMIWILKQKKELSNNVFANIFLKYLAIVDVYINFTLNLTQKNLYTKDSFLKLQHYWSDTLIKLLKNMKNAIE